MEGSDRTYNGPNSFIQTNYRRQPSRTTTSVQGRQYELPTLPNTPLSFVIRKVEEVFSYFEQDYISETNLRQLLTSTQTVVVKLMTQREKSEQEPYSTICQRINQRTLELNAYILETQFGKNIVNKENDGIPSHPMISDCRDYTRPLPTPTIPAPSRMGDNEYRDFTLKMSYLLDDDYKPFTHLLYTYNPPDSILERMRYKNEELLNKFCQDYQSDPISEDNSYLERAWSNPVGHLMSLFLVPLGVVGENVYKTFGYDYATWYAQDLHSFTMDEFVSLYLTYHMEKKCYSLPSPEDIKLLTALLQNIHPTKKAEVTRSTWFRVLSSFGPIQIYKRPSLFKRLQILHELPYFIPSFCEGKRQFLLNSPDVKVGDYFVYYPDKPHSMECLVFSTCIRSKQSGDKLLVQERIPLCYGTLDRRFPIEKIEEYLHYYLIPNSCYNPVRPIDPKILLRLPTQSKETNFSYLKEEIKYLVLQVQLNKIKETEAKDTIKEMKNLVNSLTKFLQSEQDQKLFIDLEVSLTNLLKQDLTKIDLSRIS